MSGAAQVDEFESRDFETPAAAMSPSPSDASVEFESAPAPGVAVSFKDWRLCPCCCSFVMSANTGRAGEGAKIADGAIVEEEKIFESNNTRHALEAVRSVTSGAPECTGKQG